RAGGLAPGDLFRALRDQCWHGRQASRRPGGRAGADRRGALQRVLTVQTTACRRPGLPGGIAPDASGRRRRARVLIRLVNCMARTLFQKVWDLHAVRTLPNGQTQLYIGLHLVHEVTSPQAFAELRERGWTVKAPHRTFATID